MTDQNIHVRFYDEGGPGTSRARLSGKAYTYKSSQDIKVDDVVIVRTYDPKDGPLRFAKVQDVGGPVRGGANGYNIKRVVQVLDLAAAEAEEQREKDYAQAQAILKRAVAERSQLDLFREVAHTLGEADLSLVANALGVNPDEFKAQATTLANENKKMHRIEVAYVSAPARRWVVEEVSLDAAISTAALSQGVSSSHLTARYI